MNIIYLDTKREMKEKISRKFREYVGNTGTRKHRNFDYNLVTNKWDVSFFSWYFVTSWCNWV